MIKRRVVRAVMMTPDRRVLLMKIQEPVSGFEFWVTPGGGLEPGESDKDAIRREVAEETGATRISPGQLIWSRQCEFTWDGRDAARTNSIISYQPSTSNPSWTRRPLPARHRPSASSAGGLSTPSAGRKRRSRRAVFIVYLKVYRGTGHRMNHLTWAYE